VGAPEGEDLLLQVGEVHLTGDPLQTHPVPPPQKEAPAPEGTGAGSARGTTLLPLGIPGAPRRGVTTPLPL